MTSEDRLWQLIIKKDNNDITPEELRELEHLLNENESVKTANGFIEEIWKKGISVAGHQMDITASWDAIQKRVHRDFTIKEKRIRPAFKVWMIAASLVVLFGSIVLLYSLNNSRRTSITNGQGYGNQITTQLGSRSKIILPDGTTVWLNAGSKLTYNDFHSAAEREVTLSGEAFFQVKHNAKHPFIVHTKRIDIKDIGTAFMVKAYPEDKEFEATLIEGSIEVIDQRGTQRDILLKPKERIIIPLTDSSAALKPSSFSDGKPMALYKIEKIKKDEHGLIPETAWTQNKLVFNNEQFGELAKRMERWYNIKIYFKDSLIKQTPFSGIIENETLEQALKAMQFSTSFSYKMRGNKIWIYKK